MSRRAKAKRHSFLHIVSMSTDLKKINYHGANNELVLRKLH